MTKILHILKSFGHPNQPYTTNLIERLCDEAEEVVHEVVCSKVIKESKIIEVRILNQKKALFNFRVFYYVLKHFFFDRHYKSISPKSTLKERFRFFLKWEPLLNQKIEIIHVHHLHVISNSLIHYLNLKEIKLVVSLRGKELVSDTVIEEQRVAFLNKISCFDLVHVISDFMFQKAIAQGVDKYRLKLIYRGFDFNRIKAENLREHYEIKNRNRIKAICVGRLAWEKGQFYILDSLFRLKNKGVLVSLDIFGEGTFREFLEYRVYQLGLEDQVTFKGHISPVMLKKNYKNYDIAIQPSIYEALSNGLLDLTFHNLPAVISNQGGMTEIVKNGINGVTFDICEPILLDEAIMSSLNLSIADLRAYNKKLREKFSIEKEVFEFSNMYKNLFHF